MALVQRHHRDRSSAPIISDSRTSPRGRPLPSPQSSPKGVSFPNAKVCEVLDRIWASRRLSLPQRCDYADHVTVREQDIFPPHELPVTTTLGEMSTRDTSSFSKEAEAVTGVPITARIFPTWQLRFFIRADLGGFFHTYPDVGGPFLSLQEAENAISRHLDAKRSPQMCTDGLSRSEICIRNTLYWPDGTRKKSSKSCPRRRNIVALVHSLLDKYNEDHHFFGDLAYELEDVVSSGEVYERESRSHMFYHINLTTKPREVDGFQSGDSNLFFAEVTCLEGENEEYVLNCFCVLKPNDKGRCYDCEHNESVDLKHPTDTMYKGGRCSPYPRCCGFQLPREFLGDYCVYDDEEAMLAAEESRIRRIYKCLDDPVFLAKLDEKLDGSRRAAPADSSKREDGQGKGLRKYAVPAKLDGARRAAPADSSKREDGQGKGLRKYVIPAMRLEECVVPAKLDGARRAALPDSSEREDGQGKGLRKYVVPAMRLEECVVPAKLDGARRASPPDDSSKIEDGQEEGLLEELLANTRKFGMAKRCP